MQENQEVQEIRRREFQEIRGNPGVGGSMNPLAGLAGVALLMGLAVQFSLHRLGFVCSLLATEFGWVWL